MSEYLLDVKDLQVTLPTGDTDRRLVDGLNLAIKPGQTHALLGESGCGKSMTALAILQLLPDAAQISKDSQIMLAGRDLLSLSEVQMHKIRGRQISMIFQEPMTSLNPVLTIGEQIGEVLTFHLGLRGRDRRENILQLLDSVEIPAAARRIDEYPHQLSGGMKQRVMIALALAAQPDLLIADEPTTALDVVVQAQILTLLRQLQEKTGMAIFLITHDLGIVKEMADDIAVMYAGHIVEQAKASQFFKAPCHPYSRMLFASLPNMKKRHQKLREISGFVPPLTQDFPGCRFVERCPQAMAVCRQQPPLWYQQPGGTQVRCYLYDEQLREAPPVPDQEIPAISTQPLLTEPGVRQTILAVENLKVYFPIRKGLFKRVVAQVKAVDGISFSVRQGETLAIVGESGSGKTTAGRSILQLIAATAGNVFYEGADLTQASRRALHAARRQLQIIFQDPFSSMDPRMLVGDIIIEGMAAYGIGDNTQARYHHAQALLERVGLPADSIHRYPHEFSGGQRQRICIARALATNPGLIICDEPTSALDVSVQAQILNLLVQLQQEMGLSYLFITHNMGVVSYLADNIAVMYQGKIVEYGDARQILHAPEHPYTQTLLAAVPVV